MVSQNSRCTRALICHMSQSSADASSAVQMLLDMASLGNMEGLLDLVPDSVVDQALMRKQQMR